MTSRRDGVISGYVIRLPDGAAILTGVLWQHGALRRGEGPGRALARLRVSTLPSAASPARLLHACRGPRQTRAIRVFQASRVPNPAAAAAHAEHDKFIEKVLRTDSDSSKMVSKCQCTKPTTKSNTWFSQ